MARDPRFPAARFVSPLEPWQSPTHLPPSPHNLPTDQVGRGGGGLAIGQQNTIAGVPGETANIRENYRYASLIDVSIVVGTTSVKFLDSPIGRRNMLGLRNASIGGQIMYIGFGGPASTNSWLAMTAGTIILLDTVVPQDDLYVLSSAAGGVFSYAYSTFGG